MLQTLGAVLHYTEVGRGQCFFSKDRVSIIIQIGMLLIIILGQRNLDCPIQAGVFSHAINKGISSLKWGEI